MTLREKIADWISGDAITVRDIRLGVFEARCDRLQREIDRMRDHLLHIKHLETPNMAHVGKKAVKLAKEGLGE